MVRKYKTNRIDFQDSGSMAFTAMSRHIAYILIKREALNMLYPNMPQLFNEKR